MQLLLLHGENKQIVARELCCSITSWTELNGSFKIPIVHAARYN